MRTTSPAITTFVRGGLLALSLFAANCSGRTYNTFFQPFDLIFGSGQASPSVNVSLLTATPLTNTRVMLTFNKPVSLASGQLVSNYRITGPNGNLLQILAATRDPNNSRVVFLDTIPQAGGTTYTVTASNIVGVDGSSLGSSNSATFTAPNNADQTGPQFSSVMPLSATTVEVFFNEAVDKTSSETATNYDIYTNAGCSTGNVNVTGAVRDSANQAKVTLTSAGMTSGTTYYLCGTTNIRDMWGNANTSTIVSTPFVYNASTPRVVSAVSGSPTSVLVTFDQAMANAVQPTPGVDSTPLTTRANYTFAGCGSLSASAATFSVVSSTQILLNMLANGATGTCTLTVNTAITSSAGVALTAATQSVIFSFSAATDTTAPAVASVQATNSNTVRVTFTEPIDDTTVDTSDFSFSPSLTVTGVTCYSGAGNYTYCDVTTSTDQTTQSYSATVSGIQDVAGNNLATSTTTFTGDGKPYIVAIYPVDQNTVMVEWSEPIGGSGTVNAADYSINGTPLDQAPWSPGSSAALHLPDANDRSIYVKLTISPVLTSGTSYTLTYTDGAPTSVDSSGNPTLTTVPNGGTFTGPASTQAPQVTGASSTSSSTIIVNFNEPLNNATVQSGTFDLSGGPVGCPTVVSSRQQISAGVVQLVVTSVNVAGPTTCPVTVTGVSDLAGNTIAGNNTANYTYSGTDATDVTAPTVASVVAFSNTEIRVYFSEPVEEPSGENPANYSFSPTLTGGINSIDCSGTVCTLTLNAPGTNAVQYALTISGVQDTATPTANTMASQTVNFSGIGSSVAAPTLYQAVLINSTTVELTFSEQMDLTSAQNAANYTVTGGNSVSAAVRQADATKVRLTISPGAYGSSNSYTVTGTTGLTDTAGNALGTPNSATFNGSATAPSTPSVTLDTFTTNVSGTIYSRASFPSPGIQFTGTTTANTIVYLYDDGVLVATAVSDSSGAYIVTLTSGATVTETTNVFTIATVGPTGLVSDISPGVSITYDITEPAAPTGLDLVAASDSGISSTDNITNATTPQFQVACEVGASVQLYTDNPSANTPTGSAVTCAASPVTLTTGTLAGGVHNITAKQTDVAGNISPASGSLAVTIDTSAPTLNLPVALTANSYIDLPFTGGGVYGSSSSSSPVVLGNITITLNSGTSGITISPTVTTTGGGALTGGETTIRVNLNVSGTPDGSETVQVVANSNAIFDVAGNAVSFNTGVKNFAAAGVPNITGIPTYTSTGATTGYITVVWDEAPYTASNATGILTAADFDITFTKNAGGNANSMSITGFQDGTGGTLDPGETTMRILVSFDLATSGVETFQLNAKSGEIFSGIAPYNNSPVTEQAGPFTAPDRLAPTVTNVTSSNADGYYKAGDTISIQVVFSEVVNVVGTPMLTLSTGTPATTAVNYVSGSGTNTLNFIYTVAANNLNADLDYASNAALTAGTSIRDAANNDATLTLPNPGAAGSLGANKALNVDAVVPAAPGTPDMTAATDTGSSNSDNITSNQTPQFTVTCENGASVQLYTDNPAPGTATGSAGTCAGGTVTLTAATLASGAHNITARQTDPAGNQSVASGALSVTIDTTAPAAPGTPDMTAATDTGSSNSDNITNNQTPQFTVTCENGASVQLYTDNPAAGTATGSAGTCAGGTVTLTAATLAAGAHNITARQTDPAGNQSAMSGQLAVMIDTTLPVISSVAPATNAFVNTTQVSYTLSKDCASGSVTWTRTGGAPDGSSPHTANLTGSELTQGTKTNITLTNAPTLATNAIYTVAFNCTDTAGNAATPVSSTNVTYDTTLPVISAVSPANNANVNSTSVGYTLSEICQSGSITWTRTGGSADGSSPHVQALAGSELNAGTFTGTLTNNPTLVDGTIYSVAFDCTDRAGNVGSTVTSTNVTYSPGALVITTATTLDTDNDGKIDTYRISFNKSVNDSTFPGYVANSLGSVTSHWLVAGYNNVRLIHGSAVTFATDTVNDSVIYLRFDENVLTCSAATQTGCDTAAKPDLTTTATPGLQDLTTATIAQVGTTDVTEADGAKPVLVGAKSLGPTSADAIFSEAVDTVEGQTATNYVITGGTNPTVSAAVRDGTNYNIVHLTTGTQTGGQAYTLTVNTNVKDLANLNVNSSANTANFNGVTNPVVANVVTTSATTLTITFNETVTAASTECSSAAACAAIYDNSSIAILSAVSTAGSGNNSATFTLTVNPMIEGQSYTVTVLQNTVTSVATGLKMGNTNNSATFTGDGKPAANISPDTQTQCPTPTNLPPSAPAATRVVVQFDQAVGASALTATNYKITGCITGTDCATGTGAPNSNGASVVTSMGGNKYAVDFTQSFDTDTSQYQLTVTGVQDTNGNTIALPGTMSFRCGTDTTPPSLISASVVNATAGATVVMLTFSESVDNVTANVAGNYKYDTAAYGTGVNSAARQTNTAQVQVTFVPALSNGGHQIRVRNVQDLQGNAILDNGVNNVQPIIVNAPTGFTGGPVFTDPFGDGTTAGTIAIYDGKLYLGADAASTKLFEMNYSLTTAQTITLDADGVFGTPYSSFNGYATKWSGCASITYPGTPCTSGNTISGVDTLYGACVGGSSTPQMTGSACTGAGGTERLYIGALNTQGNYRSFWHTATKSSTSTVFPFAEEYSGDTGGGAAYRSLNLIVFKDQLFVNFGAELGGGGRGGRICMNPAGCTGADNSTYLGYTGFAAMNRLKRIGASTGGSNPLRNGAYNQVTGYSDGTGGPDGQVLNAITAMYEYDNDGTGGNESQLYLANGGYMQGALGSARSTDSDGGIVRTTLAYSAKNSLPRDCSSASPAAGAGCLNFYEDVTPDANTKWNSYLSTPLPQNSAITGSGNCGTSLIEMDCTLPYNLFVPALKAIPYFRKAPNGDLYMLRNACSTKTLNRNGVNGAGGFDFRTERQVCPKGYEVPQLWMMPANCGSAASCATAWQLVAEYGSTGKTNMRSNNAIGANNTHITLLEFVGNWLYVGWDNAIDGANVWRVDFNSATCTGSQSCMVSGNKPAETQFSIVNLPGIESGGGGSNQKIFSHVTVNDAGKDWLIIITRDGSNAMKIYRTANDQN